MIPIPVRVPLPAAVSLLSALWALGEWRSWHEDEIVAAAEPDELLGEAAERRRDAAEDRAERKLRLEEAREARLAQAASCSGPDGGE